MHQLRSAETGKAAENDSSSMRRSSSRGRMAKALLLLVGTILVTARCGGHSGEAAAPARSPDPPQVRAALLIEAYTGNEISADRMYKGHRVIVTGVIQAIARDILNQPYLLLGSTEALTSPTVQCVFSGKSEALLATLRKGNPTAPTCTVKGKLVNILLDDCSF